MKNENQDELSSLPTLLFYASFCKTILFYKQLCFV